MLCLSRKIGEEIVILDSSGRELITIKITDINGNRTHVGLTAPMYYTIHRREVLERLRKQQAILGSNEVIE